MTNLKENVLASIRKINFLKESKKDPSLQTKSINNFQERIKEHVLELSKEVNLFEANNIVIQALNERIVEISKMRSEHDTFSKKDKVKDYFTNIIGAIKLEIIILYEKID